MPPMERTAGRPRRMSSSVLSWLSRWDVEIAPYPHTQNLLQSPINRRSNTLTLSHRPGTAFGVGENAPQTSPTAQRNPPHTLTLSHSHTDRARPSGFARPLHSPATPAPRIHTPLSYRPGTAFGVGENAPQTSPTAQRNPPHTLTLSYRPGTTVGVGKTLHSPQRPPREYIHLSHTDR